MNDTQGLAIAFEEAQTSLKQGGIPVSFSPPPPQNQGWLD
jgi:hypothetical protein